MNRLRKIGNWLWLNKERMVLAIMVCFLIFRVYQVVSPPGDGENVSANFRPPSPRPPETVDTPGLPPPPPTTETADDWSRLWRFNPFVYRQPRDVVGGGTDAGQSEINVKLIRIREARPGQYLAQIETASRTGWYSEGDLFEAFELLEIDANTECVTIFSEQLQRSTEICVE